MGGRSGNRVALLGLIAASSFAIGLLTRLLARFGVAIDAGVALALALVVPLLLYPLFRPERGSESAAPAMTAQTPWQVGVANPHDVEEEPNASV